MGDRFVGFYWTLAVNWAGFRTLPADADAAGRRSKTIRYQLELVRDHARKLDGQMVGEFVYVECSPDRGTDAILPELEKAAKLCRDQDAILVYVNFTKSFGWRPHSFMLSFLESSGILFEGLDTDPIPILIDGKSFNPARHFRQWRVIHEGKTFALRNAALSELQASFLRLGKIRDYAAIADDLNSRQVKTSTGKIWSPDGVRKALTRYVLDRE